MKQKGVFYLLKESITGWGENDAFLHASSLAYYTIFSIAPLVIITVGVVGIFFSQAVAEGVIVNLLESWVGAEIATLIEDILLNASGVRRNSIIATTLGALIMLYGASIVFFRMQVSINTMLGIVPKTNDVRASIFTALRKGLLAAASVMGIGIYLLALLIFNSVWTALPTGTLERLFSQVQLVAVLVAVIITPLLYMIPFALVYKAMPQATIRWRDVLPGAALAAVLFWIGGYVIGVYLGVSGFTTVYGAAGSLVAFLIWIFYSALIFLFGAKFMQVYAKMYGVPIVPDENAMFVS